jgi:AcrR family transcriptional regulator
LRQIPPAYQPLSTFRLSCHASKAIPRRSSTTASVAAPSTRFLALLAEHSYGELTVNHILQRIGMSSRTFYALFESKDDCPLTAYRFLTGRLEVKLGDAWQAEQSWPAKVRAAIAAALAFAAEDPAVARLLAVEVQAGDRAARAAQAESIDRLAAKLREGTRPLPRRGRPQPLHRADHRRRPGLAGRASPGHLRGGTEWAQGLASP